MRIPQLLPTGFLPPGIFDCEMDDLRRCFGTFQQTDRRPVLFARLQEFVDAVQKSELFEALLIDGSFVTAKVAPNDIDLLAVLRPNHNFERDLPISEYALVSRAMLRRRFGFDVVIAERGTTLYDTYIDFFSRVREAPDVRKGLLRLAI